MKAGLWVAIGAGIGMALAVIGLVVGGLILQRQVWSAAPAVTAQPETAWQYMGWPGCGGMGYRAGGAATPSAPSPGGFGCWGYRGGRGATALTTPLTMAAARQAVEQYIAARGSTGLDIAELMEFEYNFYALIREADTGIGAMELLVDKWTGVVGPEMGPNMMWNGKYGMHARGGGMMGGAALTNTLSSDEAARIAQRWLDAYRPGETVEHVEPFYGYYTIHTQRDGRIAGMLSVHGTTGQVWYHTWHGAFIAKEDSTGSERE